MLVVATATILTALAFEHLGGYAPCPLCLEERYAYYFAVPASALALFLARGDRTGIARILLLLIALAFLANMAAGIFHAGVEWKWWPGPGECSGAFELQWGAGRRRRYADHPLRRGVLALPGAVLRRVERDGLGVSCACRGLRREPEALTHTELKRA